MGCCSSKSAATVSPSIRPRSPERARRQGGTTAITFAGPVSIGQFPALAPPRSRKTTIFNARNSKDIDDHTRKAPKNLGLNFAKLVEYLLKAAKTDVMKVRSFYVWICSKNYDEISETYQPDLETPFGYLSAIRKSNANQSGLFQKFCDIAKIPCLTVGGPTRTGKYEPNEDLSGRRNSWNLVYCGQGWRIVDCHWGGSKSAITIPNPAWILIDSHFNNDQRKRSEAATRSDSGNSDTTYELDEFYFLTDPDQFIYSHWADKPEHQLLDAPISLEEFKNLALLASGFFEVGLHLKSHFHILTKHDKEEVNLEFALPMNVFVSFSYKLFINQKGTSTNVIDNIPLEKFVFEQNQNKIACFTLRVPAASYYKLLVYGRLCDESDQQNSNLSLSLVSTYFFQCSTKAKNVTPLPNDAPTHFGPTPEMRFLGISPVTHLSGVVETDKYGNAEIRLKMTRLCDFLSNFFSIKYSKEELESFVVMRTVGNQQIISLKCPEPGEYVLEFFAKESTNTNNSFPYIFSYLVQFKAEAKAPTKKGKLTPRWPVSKGSKSLGPNHKVIKEQGVRAMVTDYFLYTDENGEFEIDFEFDSPIDFLFDCTSVAGKEERDGIFLTEMREKSATVFGRLPGPGFYLITVYTKPSGQDTSYPQSFYFMVYAPSCRKKQITWPKTYNQWSTGCELQSPTRGQLEPNKDTWFSVKIPGAEDVATIRGSNWDHLENNGSGQWSKNVNTGPGGEVLKLSVKKPKTGNSYYTFMEFNVEKPADWDKLMSGNGLVFDKNQEERAAMLDLGDISDDEDDENEFQEMEEEKEKARIARDVKNKKRVAAFEEEMGKVHEGEKELEQLKKQVVELQKEVSKSKDPDKLQQAERELRQAESACQNADHENVRAKMRAAIVLRDEGKIRDSMNEFETKDVPDIGGDYTEGAELLVFFSLRNNLLDAIDSNQIELIQDAMQAVYSHGFEDELQIELIEAKYKIRKLRRLMTLRHEIMDLNQAALAEVKSYKDPSGLIRDIFYATFRLLGEKKSALKEWTSVCALLGKLGKEHVRKRIVNFSPSDVSEEVIMEVREVLNKYQIEEVRAVSVAAGAFFVWARGVVDNY